MSPTGLRELVSIRRKIAQLAHAQWGMRDSAGRGQIYPTPHIASLFSVDQECNVLMSMRSVAAIASVMHHATQASASSAYGYRHIGGPAGHQETARATVMCPGCRCRCVLRYWRGSSPWAPRQGCEWFAHSATLSDSQPVLRHRGYDHWSCEASRATSQAWPASSSLMPLCASR